MGELTIESEKGKGSVFTVRLPINAAAARSENDDPAEAGSEALPAAVGAEALPRAATV